MITLDIPTRNRSENALSRSALSHPFSHRYDDFAPIHRAVVGRAPAGAPVASAS